MNPTEKTGKETLVSCRLKPELFVKFSAAVRAQGATKSLTLRQLIMAYVKLVEKQDGNPIVALEFKACDYGEANRRVFLGTSRLIPKKMAKTDRR